METAVKRIGAVVVAELRACGYMESTIGQYEKTIRALTKFIDGHGGAYTPALGAAFASMTVSPRTGRFSAQRQFDYRRLVGVFDAYLRTGHVDLSQRKRGGGGERPGSGEFMTLAAAWEADMDDRGLALATRAAYGRSPAATWSFWNHAASAVSRPPMAPASWRSWRPCRTGGRRRRCRGWYRTSARS